MNLLNGIIFLDYKIQNFFLNLRNDCLDNFFLIFTNLGIWQVILGMCVIASFVLYYNKKNSLIAPLFVAILGSGLSTLIIKYLVNRARPGEDFAVYTEKLASFPSAHATLVTAFFGFLIYCFWRAKWSFNLKIFLSIISLLIILLIGFSRIYLGVHFISDVVGGYIIGLIWVFIAIYISKRSNPFK